MDSLSFNVPFEVVVKQPEQLFVEQLYRYVKQDYLKGLGIGSPLTPWQFPLITLLERLCYNVAV